MTFSDDFATLDPTRWAQNFHPPTGQPNHDYAGKVAIVDHQLSLTVSKDSAGVFHIASIDTKPKSGHPGFVQQYGILAVEAKIPKGAGLWAAPLWLYGSGSGWVNELDVSEVLGGQPTYDMCHIHYRKADGSDGSVGGRYPVGFDLSLDFHEYKAEWRADAVRWYVDGRLIHTETTHIPDHPLPLIIDLSIGGPTQLWAGTPSPSFRSATMLVRRVTVAP